MEVKNARAEENRLEYLLEGKWKREYYDMVGFARARMLLKVVRFNTLLLKGQRAKRGLISKNTVWECAAGV